LIRKSCVKAASNSIFYIFDNKTYKYFSYLCPRFHAVLASSEAVKVWVDIVVLASFDALFCDSLNLRNSKLHSQDKGKGMPRRGI
jgi:hypothetical protein